MRYTTFLLLSLLSTARASHVGTLATCSRLIRDAEKHFYTSKNSFYMYLLFSPFREHSTNNVKVFTALNIELSAPYGVEIFYLK